VIAARSRLLLATAAATLAIVAATAAGSAPPAIAQQQQAFATSSLRLVVIVTRDGVHPPASYAGVAPYAARRWPTWYPSAARLGLTPHGTLLATLFGSYYRTFYAKAGLLEPNGCPAADGVYAWANPDAAAQTTADALLAGIAAGCGLMHQGLTSVSSGDPIFAPLPTVDKADPALAQASLNAAIGAAGPNEIVRTYQSAFAQLDAVLDCAAGVCKQVSSLPTSIATDPATGLVSLKGPVDTAAAAVEDLRLEYAQGLPGAAVGWGHLDRQTLFDLSQLYTLRSALEDRSPYAARVTASNLATRVLATIDRSALTPAPPQSRFVAFVGHDTNLAQLGGLLRLSWLVPGYQRDDTPPGSALIFELHNADRSVSQPTPFVQVFFAAQPLDAMRNATAASTLVPVQRVPVDIPGCPELRCPIATFDAVVKTAIDPAFVSR
jgi:4-phytase / acid phosphatase